jgi:hypothetical protein
MDYRCFPDPISEAGLHDPIGVKPAVSEAGTGPIQRVSVLHLLKLPSASPGSVALRILYVIRHPCELQRLKVFVHRPA